VSDGFIYSENVIMACISVSSYSMELVLMENSPLKRPRVTLQWLWRLVMWVWHSVIW